MFICCDNTGKNQSMEERSKASEWQLGLEYKYTARDMPQQNHLEELGFTSLANKGRALIYHANLPPKIKMRLFTETFETATILDGLTVIEIDGLTMTRFEHFHGMPPKITDYL